MPWRWCHAEGENTHGDYCIHVPGYKAITSVPDSIGPSILHYLLLYGPVAFPTLYHHVLLNFIHTSGHEVTQQQMSLAMLPPLHSVCTCALLFPLKSPMKAEEKNCMPSSHLKYQHTIFWVNGFLGKQIFLFFSGSNYHKSEL